MVFEKIQHLLVEKLDCDKADITPDTKFSELGIDSLDITELVMNLEDEFGVEIGMDSSLVSVSNLVAKIESNLQ